jgi:hypothetical protein
MAAIVIIGLGVAEFALKFVYPYGGETIAAMMAAMPLLCGLRHLRRPFFLVLLLFVFLMAVPYFTHFKELTTNGVEDYKPWNRIVIVGSLLLFLSARLDQGLLRRLALAVVLGCLWEVLVGWYRFLSGTGGLTTEHALNYWGIRYAISSRNADVLYAIVPILLSQFVPWQWVRWGATLLCLPATVLTYSRSAWLTLIYHYFRVRRLLSFALLGLVLVAIALTTNAGDTIVDRFLTIFDINSHTSNLERANLLQFSLGHVTAFGLGPGRFPTAGVSEAGLGGLRQAEDFYLTMAVEAGVLATAAFLGLWIWSLVTSPVRRIGIGLSIYLLLNSEVDNIVVWLIFGLVMHTALNATEPGRVRPAGRSRTPAAPPAPGFAGRSPPSRGPATAAP